MKNSTKLVVFVMGAAVVLMQIVRAQAPNPATDPRIDPHVRAFLADLNKDSSPFWELPQPKPQEILTALQNQSTVDMSGVTTVEKTITTDGRAVKLYIMTPQHAAANLGNRLNAGHPSEDMATYGKAVIQSIANVVSANGTSEDPQAYAETVAHRFFPNILPYKVGTPAVFGFAEWNGRSLTDNAPDVMFSIAANTPVSLGIGRESVTSKPSKTFPYVPTAS